MLSDNAAGASYNAQIQYSMTFGAWKRRRAYKLVTLTLDLPIFIIFPHSVYCSVWQYDYV